MIVPDAEIVFVLKLPDIERLAIFVAVRLAEWVTTSTTDPFAGAFPDPKSNVVPDTVYAALFWYTPSMYIKVWFSSIGFVLRVKLVDEPSPEICWTVWSPVPIDLCHDTIWSISPVVAAAVKTTAIPLVAVKSVSGSKRIPFKYTFIALTT